MLELAKCFLRTVTEECAPTVGKECDHIFRRITYSVLTWGLIQFKFLFTVTFKVCLTHHLQTC